MKTGRDAMGVAFMGDRLFTVGGFDGQAYLNFVEAYDPLTNIWQQVNLFFYECTLLFDDLISIFFSQFAPLPYGRAGSCIAVVRDTVPPAI